MFGETRWTLGLLLLGAAAAAGCSLPGRGQDVLADYERAWRDIESPARPVAQASFEQSEARPDDAGGLHWRDLAPARLAETTQKLTGRGPDPDEAKKLYGQADSLFRQAMQSKGEERRKQLADAAGLYEKAARRWPDSALEQDALYMVGESYFFADRYPKANEVWEQLLKKYPQSRYLDLVEARRFSIAQYWLKADRAEHGLAATAARLWDSKRPRLDAFGRAVKIFDKIRMDDPTGKLADDATLAAGNAYFTAGRFLKADEFYTDLRKTYPSSEHQFRAHLLGLKAKLQSYQGPQYSGAALDEAEKLIEQIRKQFPVEAQKQRDYLARAYAEVRYRKAEREWTQARYRDRRKEYRAARFYYDRILHDYADTPFAEQARQRVAELRGKPSLPPQRLGWLVKLFPDSRPAQPLIADNGLGVQKR